MARRSREVHHELKHQFVATEPWALSSKGYRTRTQDSMAEAAIS